MKFKLYEGRRIIPHTKAEMNSKRNGLIDPPFVTAKVTEEDTNNNTGPFDLKDLQLGFWIKFDLPTGDFSINSCIDPTTGKFESSSDELERLPLASTEVSNISISISLVHQFKSGYKKDYFNDGYINVRFKRSGDTYIQTSICDKVSHRLDSTEIEVIAPAEFNEKTLPKFGLLVFSKLMQAFPYYVLQLIETTRIAIEGDKFKYNEV